jgi:sulfoxide reductase heme-binding subunit YedZ
MDHRHRESSYNAQVVHAMAKSKMKLRYRHALVACLAAAVSIPFWYGRLDWDPEMRFWRAVGDGSFVLLFLALVIGPAARHWPYLRHCLSWRRELGIWFAILALAHTLLVLDGWIRWDWMRFFGYEFLNQFGRYARVEPGFGLSNLVGVVAAILAVPLTLTSSKWAVNRLGGSSWKWLHIGAYTIFYLVVLHSLYFLFMHYTVSFHQPVPDPNWFRYPFLIAAFVLLGFQMSAFFQIVRKRAAARSRGQLESQPHE